MLVFILVACSTEDTNGNKTNNEENNKSEDNVETPADKNGNQDGTVKVPKGELQKKDQGDQVELLQESLNELGYDITVSGTFDEATTWAVTDFQLQHENLMALGIYNEETEQVLADSLANGEKIEAGAGLPLVAEPAATNAGTPVIANPYDQLALINKEHALPAEYNPEDLVVPNVRFPFTEELPKKQMREIAALALEELFQAADEDGLELFAQSGYRSYDTQVSLFANYVSANGEEAANKFSALPGESEHQSGLAMDVTSVDVSYLLDTDFGDTEEGKWVKEHAAEFGFIIRYPKGKEEITQYQFEPWHLRYVGEKAAKEIMDQGITLEEYFNENE
ncbi:carboxypeptidase [Oceanobacillus chungangensis]|uniref:Carboxypeptidase n=2 Tax=Oceanobacillus chungangensis TaxID=1229152 RepID=A0A3D8Q1J9_9BACI|nr:carboxypeptidase [Oceanobacillus chungangensis]